MAKHSKTAVPVFATSIRLRPDARAVLVRAVESGAATDFTDAIHKFIARGAPSLDDVETDREAA